MSPPLRPDAPTARRWLSDELAERRYNDGDWASRLGEWLENWLESFFNPGGPSAVTGQMIFAVIIAALLLVLVIVLIRWLPRRRAPQTITDHPETAIGPLDDADRHRRAAAGHRARGDHGAAVIESYRALVSAATERRMLHPVPGLTAQQAARELATEIPSLAAELKRAADCFDIARYAQVRVGGVLITADDADFVADLEGRVTRTPQSRSTTGRAAR